MVDVADMKQTVTGEEMINTLGLMNGFLEKAEELGLGGQESFECLVAMIVEEYCYRHGLKAEEEFRNLAEICTEINDMMGRYDPGKEEESMEAVHG